LSNGGNYELGGIELLLQASADSASKEILLIKKNVQLLKRSLLSLAKEVKPIKDTIKALKQFGKIEVPSFGRLQNQLEKISKLNLRETQKAFDGMATSIKPFIDELVRGERALIAMAAISSKMGGVVKATSQLADQTSRVADEAKRGKEPLARLFQVGKLMFAVNMGRRYARIAAGMINQAAVYQETLYMFATSFRHLGNEALNFGRNFARSFGVAEQTILRIQSSVNNVLIAAGNIPREVAFAASQAMTMFTMDYAAMFGKSMEQALRGVQSMLAGQVRDIRQGTGIDPSNLQLMRLLEELGDPRHFRQISVAERQLLIMTSAMRQMSALGGVGFSITAADRAMHQLRVLQEQFIETGRFLGQIFLNIIGRYLPYINGAIIAFNTLLGRMAGELRPNIDYSGIVDDAEEAARQIQGLFSFDQFEVLSQPELQTGVSEDIMRMFQEQMEQYKSRFSEIEMQAHRIAESILLWVENNQEFLNGLRAIGGIIGGMLIYGAIAKVLAKLKLIPKVLGLFKPKLLLIKLFVSAFAFAALNSENFRESIGRLVQSLQPLMSSLQRIFDVFVRLMRSAIVPAIGFIVELVASIIQLLDNLSILEPLMIIIIGLFVAWKALKFYSIIKAKVSALILFISKLFGTKSALLGATSAQWGLNKATAAMGVGILGLVGAIAMFVSGMGDMSRTSRILIPVIAILAAALAGLAVAKAAAAAGIAAPFKAIATAAALAGAMTLAVGTAVATIPRYAQGGFPTQGQMFIANEAGPELVGNIGGRTAVANNDMIIKGIEEAAYRGIIRGLRDSGNNGGGNINVTVEALPDGLLRVLDQQYATEGRGRRIGE